MEPKILALPLEVVATLPWLVNWIVDYGEISNKRVSSIIAITFRASMLTPKCRVPLQQLWGRDFPGFLSRLGIRIRMSDGILIRRMTKLNQTEESEYFETLFVQLQLQTHFCGASHKYFARDYAK